jgi:zinc protease
MLNREFAPASGKLDSFVLPKIFFFKADNGLKVSTVNKPKLPIVQFDFIIFSGSSLDFENKHGLANLTSMVIDEGAGEYSSLQLAEEFEKLGSFFSIETHAEYIKLSLFTLKENAARSFELVSKIIQYPQFNEDDFQREKNKAITHLIRLSDESNYLAEVAFDKILHRNSYLQYPKLGTLSTVKNIMSDDCRKYYRDNFAVQNMQLIATGDIQPDELNNLINKYMNDIKPVAQKNLTEINLSNHATAVYLTDKENSVQSEIRIGRISTPRNEGNHFARAVMNTILGGSFVSRINLNLREEKGFTYGARSSFLYYQHLSDFIVSTAVETQNTVQTVEEIFKEFRKMRESISQNEIDFAKAYLIKKFPSHFESYEQINQNIFNIIYFSLPENYFDNYVENIEAITSEQVKETAIKEIVPEEMQIIITGDKEKLTEPLSQYSKGSVIFIDKKELTEKF